MRGIAEGIERIDQLEALRDIGFEFGQGYLFSGAVSAAECEVLLSRATLLPTLESKV
jgi:EAL domain-containing protein (putative c-di-GMP-specific phosphodiesterase class I)